MEHTLALIERSHQGDKEARDTIFKENAGLIYSVAKRFLGRGVDMEDLFQIGSIGLLKAVDHFDTSFEVRFSTYAVPMIVEDFMERYQESVSYVNEHTEEAAKLIGDYDIVSEEIAKKALPECNIVYIDGAEMKEKLSGYLEVLEQENPQAVGGALPADEFYYDAE